MLTSQTNRLSIVYHPISILKPNPKNPRIHDKKQLKQLAESMNTFGFINPVIIDKDYNVICGHGRIMACPLAGITEVPTILVDYLTPAQQKAYMLADNKLVENSKWNDALLSEILIELSIPDLDFSVETTGFTTGEIDFRIIGKSLPQSESDDEIPEITDIAVSKLEDIWILGEHRIACGNALDEEVYNQLMQGELATAAITDPPYNVKINGHVSSTDKHREFEMGVGEMLKPEYIVFLGSSFSLMAKFSIQGSIHMVFIDWRHLDEISRAGEKHYSELKNVCVWCKDNAGMGSFYRSQHEFVFIFKNGTASHINNIELGKYGRHRSNVWNYPGINSFKKSEEGDLSKIHPTVKNTSMIGDAIMDITNRGDIVLDPFLGSGTAIIAAERVGRRCFGIELDPLYVDAAVRRWQKLTGLQAYHAVSGELFNNINK